jgi:hypothetical protein
MPFRRWNNGSGWHSSYGLHAASYTRCRSRQSSSSLQAQLSLTRAQQSSMGTRENYENDAALRLDTAYTRQQHMPDYCSASRGTRYLCFDRFCNFSMRWRGSAGVMVRDEAGTHQRPRSLVDPGQPCDKEHVYESMTLLHRRADSSLRKAPVAGRSKALRSEDPPKHVSHQWHFNAPSSSTCSLHPAQLCRCHIAHLETRCSSQPSSKHHASPAVNLLPSYHL